jgi:hypothetical protein
VPGVGIDSKQIFFGKSSCHGTQDTEDANLLGAAVG